MIASDSIALLTSARPSEVKRLLARLYGRGPIRVIHADGYPVDALAGLSGISFEADRFSIEIAETLSLRGAFSMIAIPFTHSHPERHGYRNVEEFAAALAPRRIMRHFAHGLLEESPVLTPAEVTAFHDAAEAAFAFRREERLRELGDFTGRMVEDVRAECHAAEERGFALWKAAAPSTAEEISAFYRDHDFYLYQLTKANYFSGGRTEYLGDLLGQIRPKMNVLEFGPGVGEVALGLARHGANLSVVDINAGHLDFIAFKAKRRGLAIRCAASLPNGPFDAILALDVLEHLADPIETTEALCERLAPNGLFIVRLPIEDEDVPMHFAGTRDKVEGLLARRGFERVGTMTDLDAWRRNAE